MEAKASDRQVSEPEPAEPELSWAELLLAYRLSRGQRAAATLLARLEPWLVKARRTLLAAAPLLDDDDVAQELVVRVLARAGEWEPNCEEQWIPRRLVEPVERAVRNALRSQRRRNEVALDEQVPAPQVEEPMLFLLTPIGKSSVADIQVIYRFHVLGEPLAALAEEFGVTPRQMRRRIELGKRRGRAQ